MTDEAQPFDPARDLLVAAERATAPWLRRAIVRTAATGGVRADGWPDLDQTVDGAAAEILDRLRVLLATDVDDQRTNPLSIYRSGLGPVTALLKRHDVAEPARDPFVAHRFADDPYGLGPATWADVDPDLHPAGLVWGAWKAKTVLDRRRAEGKR